MGFQPPMTMMDFFRRSESTWFCQRVVHHFDATADEIAESNLTVEVIEPGDGRIVEVCEGQNMDPRLAVGGASFSWQVNLDDRELNPKHAAILIDVPNPDDPTAGKLLRNQGYVELMPVLSRYHFAADGVLTINTDYANNQGQERCWFVDDSFRVRVSTVRMMGGVNLMTYSSERRCVAPQVLAAFVEQHRLHSPQAVR